MNEILKDKIWHIICGDNCTSNSEDCPKGDDGDPISCEWCKTEMVNALLDKEGYKKVKEANIPEPDSDMLMDLAGQDEFIAFQIYVKSIGKANPNGIFTEVNKEEGALNG